MQIENQIGRKYEMFWIHFFDIRHFGSHHLKYVIWNILSSDATPCAEFGDRTGYFLGFRLMLDIIMIKIMWNKTTCLVSSLIVVILEFLIKSIESFTVPTFEYIRHIDAIYGNSTLWNEKYKICNNIPNRG